MSSIKKYGTSVRSSSTPRRFDKRRELWRKRLRLLSLASIFSPGSLGDAGDFGRVYGNLLNHLPWLPSFPSSFRTRSKKASHVRKHHSYHLPSMEQLEIRQVLAAAEFVLADSPTDLQLSFSNSGSGDEILLSDSGSILQSYSVAEDGPFDAVTISLADLSSATSFELGVDADVGSNFGGSAVFRIALTGSKFDDALTPKTMTLARSTLPEIAFDGGQGDDAILGDDSNHTWFITGEKMNA